MKVNKNKYLAEILANYNQLFIHNMTKQFLSYER